MMDTTTTDAVKQVYQAPKLEAVHDYNQLTMSFGSTIPEFDMPLPSLDDFMMPSLNDF